MKALAPAEQKIAQRRLNQHYEADQDATSQQHQGPGGIQVPLQRITDQAPDQPTCGHLHPTPGDDPEKRLQESR